MIFFLLVISLLNNNFILGLNSLCKANKMPAMDAFDTNCHFSEHLSRSRYWHSLCLRAKNTLKKAICRWLELYFKKYMKDESVLAFQMIANGQQYISYEISIKLLCKRYALLEVNPYNTRQIPLFGRALQKELAVSNSLLKTLSIPK